MRASQGRKEAPAAAATPVEEVLGTVVAPKRGVYAMMSLGGTSTGHRTMMMCDAAGACQLVVAVAGEWDDDHLQRALWDLLDHYTKPKGEARLTVIRGGLS